MFKDKRIDKLQSVLVSMVILLAFFNPVLIVSAAGSETISIGSATVNPNDTVVLPITLAEATDIAGVTLTVVYDANIVTIQNVVANSSVSGSSVTPNIDNTAGRTIIVLVNTNYITTTSAVPIIDITFEVVGSSGSSTLELQDVELSDSDFNPLEPGTINNGEITIVSAPTVTIHSPPAITNDSTPLLYATFDQIATSWYVLDGAAGTGGFNTDNLTVILPELSEGQHTVTVYANNSNGMIGNASQDFLVDTIAPVVMIDTVTSPTNINSQTVTGTMENGATVEVTCLTATVSTVTYPTDTTWSVDLTDMGEGANVITATATDQAVNTASDTATIALDSLTTITIDEVTSPTNINSQTVTGTMENGATVGVTCSTATVGAVTNPTDTTWSVEITGMTEGDNVITATATDQIGNTASDTATIVLDSVTTLTIDDVTSPTNLDYQTVTGTTESGATVEVTCSTATVGTVTVTDITWSVEITGMTEGDNVITATATDQLGNTASDTATIIVDSVTTITIDDITTPTNLDYQTVTGTMENDATVGVTCPTATVGTVTYPTDTTWSVEITGMTEGDNLITATATDQLSNTALDTVTIVLDTTLPTITIDSVTSPTNLDYQTVTGTMESGAEVEVTCLTATVGTVTVTDTTWSVEIKDMTDGDNVITANATDSFEYTASDTATIVLDITPPSIISVTLNDTVVQTGAPIEVNVSATDEYGIDSVTADGTLLTLTDGYYVGTITASTSPVTVNVTDDAGNRATDTSATYTIDDTGPTISSVTLNDTVVKIGARIEVTVSATDDNGIDSVTADGTPLTLTGEYYVGTITAGTSPVTIIATDEADNLATDTSAAYTIDDIEPELILKLITKGNESTLYINSSEPLWNCTVNDEICLNSSLENWSYPLNKSGEYNIIGTDHAGNEALRNLTLETGEIEKTDYNQTNYTTGNGNVTLNITTNQDVNQTSNITICEYDENPVGSLNATTISLLGINKFVQIEVDDHLNDSIGTVRISINYSGANLSEIDEDSLKLYVWNNSIESWEELDPSENDKTNQTVWGKLDHLSIFGILGEIPEPEDVLDDGDEGYDGDDNGPSGGGGGASGELYENIVFSETDRQYITQNSDISYSFNLDCNIVQYVNFTGLTGAGRIATKVEILNDTSTLVDNPPSDIVYKNLNIWVGNAGWATEKNIDDATVVFTVEKSWVTDNNIDETTISLNRYSDNNWDKLVTRKVTEDSNWLYFEAETSGFSPFAVTGKKTMGESRGEGIIDPTVTAEKTPTPTETKGIPGFSLFAGLSILLIAVQLLRRKN